MTIEVVMGIFTGALVLFVNEVYRRNLKKEINEVKKEIWEARLDLKRDSRWFKKMIIDTRVDLKNDSVWLIEQIIRVCKKDKELMELLKREVPRINEEE